MKMGGFQKRLVGTKSPTAYFISASKSESRSDPYRTGSDSGQCELVSFPRQRFLTTGSFGCSRLARLIKQAHFKEPAALEDIDYRMPRGLQKAVVAGLSSCDWVTRGQHLLITGPTGVGKTWLACAFGMQAARRGMVVQYTRLPRLLEGLELARASGGLPKLREQLARTSLLILDDWAVAPINDQGRQDLLEVIDDRVGRSALIITSQLPVADWHAYLGEATIADAILDRVVHAAHRLELKGESMRKVRATTIRSGE